MGGMESDLHQERCFRVIINNEPKEAAWSCGAGSEPGQGMRSRNSGVSHTSSQAGGEKEKVVLGCTL